MICQHGVEDFDKWKGVFDSVYEMRKGAGEQSAQVLRGVENPNMITMIFEWDTLENARAYANNPNLGEAMGAAGVNTPPSFRFLTA